MITNMRINKKNGDGYETLHPETNSDVVLVGNKNLTEELKDINEGANKVVENFDNQTAIAIKGNKNLNEYGLKYLLRKDAEVAVHRADSLTTIKTITIPENKLVYLIKGYVKHYYSSGTTYGYIKVINSDDKINLLADSQRLTNNRGLYFRNILFTKEDYFYSKPNEEMGFESTNLEFITILPNSIKELEIQRSEVTLLLLDKDTGGIDYSDFN